MSARGRRVLGYLALVGFFVFASVMSVGMLVFAYQDLTGPRCHGHRMGPADTCTVLTIGSGMRARRIEAFNPAGTEPAILTPPANVPPEHVTQGVYGPQFMQHGERMEGAGYLSGGVILLAALVGTFVIPILKPGWKREGRRLILRSGVRRSGDEIVCRYMPLYEGSLFIACIVLGVVGAGAVYSGFWPAIVVLIVPVLAPFFAVYAWRRVLLCITPSLLRVRGVAGARTLTEIRREDVQTIEPKWENVSRTKRLLVEVGYRVAGMGGADDTDDDATDAHDTTKTIKLGLQLTVQPMNLLNGLRAWKDGAYGDPGEMLDRVERILRGRGAA